jgi:ubiquinol-cytochrome c reductase subunit 8
LSTGGRPQKGIITYGLSPNRQNPFAGAAHDAVFNTWRRFSAQVLYFAPPFIAGYYLMHWATERYGFIPLSACEDGRDKF